MDRGAWRATVHGVAKSRTRLSTETAGQLAAGWRDQDNTSTSLGVKVATCIKCIERLTPYRNDQITSASKKHKACINQ